MLLITSIALVNSTILHKSQILSFNSKKVNQIVFVNPLSQQTSHETVLTSSQDRALNSVNMILKVEE